jgi:DNA repair protein RecO (recombination protein O)
MIKKTEGIVLRAMKHQDANLITTVYTEQFGLQSFMVKGFRSSRSRRKFSYFQPLSIIDLVFIHKENRSLQTVTESKSAFLLNSVQTHPVKLSLGLAMVEIFKDTVREEEPNPQMYALLRNTLVQLEQADRRMIHFFIYFVTQLTRHLGFSPNDQSNNARHIHFDYKNGTFRPAEYDKEPVSRLLHRFLYSELSTCQDISFDGDEKRNLIKTLFAYYQEHIEGFRYPQTLRVFAEVFG